MIDDAEQVGDGGPVQPVEPPPQLGHPLALRSQLRLPQLRRGQDLVHQLRADRVAQLGEPPAGQLGVPVGGEPEAEPELGVVLEERVRPGRAAPVGVRRPGRGRQVAAVDRRAAGRVRDHQPVAEQLREQLHVRRLAATRAGAGELEQRLEELRAAHRAEVDPRPVARRQRLEERDVVPLGGDQRLARREVDRLAGRVARRDDRARLDAQLAAGAVLDVDLQRVTGVGQADGVQRRRAEPVRCALEAGLVVVPGADHAVRADEAAVAALDAEVGVPDRDELRDVALLVGRRAARIRAVDRQRADRQVVAPAGQHLRGDRADELGRVRGDDRRQPAVGRHPLGHVDPVQALERTVDRGLVALDHLGAAPAVSLGDRRLDPVDRLRRAAALRRRRRSRSAG